MCSSRYGWGNILQFLSSPETIVPTHVVDQSYQHHSTSWPANVSSNYANTHQIPDDSIALVPHRRAKLWRLSGLRSFANITGKIPRFRRSPRLASENHVSPSAQPPRREHRPADSPSAPILGTTSHDRSGQVRPLFDLLPPLIVLTSKPPLQAAVGADHAQNVAEHPVSLPKLYDIFSSRRARRKQQQSVSRPSPPHPPTIPPPPLGLLPNRTSQDPLRPESRQLGGQNQAHSGSPHKRDVTGPCPQQVDRTPPDQPSVGTSTYPPASLNYPGVSASLSSSRPVQPLGRTCAPRGPPPEKLKAPRIGAPSRLPHFPNEGEGRALPNEHDPKNPSVTPNDQVHTDLPWEPNAVPSYSGNDPEVGKDISALTSEIMTPHFQPRWSRTVKTTTMRSATTAHACQCPSWQVMTYVRC